MKKPILIRDSLMQYDAVIIDRPVPLIVSCSVGQYLVTRSCITVGQCMCLTVRIRAACSIIQGRRHGFESGRGNFASGASQKNF